MSAPPERFDLREIAPQPWQNGAGLTREIALGGADPARFDWRLSVAEVTRDAPFSAFPGVDRCIVLLAGAGKRLRSPDGAIDHALTRPLEPFRFPGEVPLAATLAGGASRDFNVMMRRGVFRSELRCTHAAADLAGGDVSFALCIAGAWALAEDATSATTAPIEPLQALLWRAPVAPLRLEPRGAAATLLLVRLYHDRPR
ncbi:MAG TPA: HutD family protein [Burkholderiaceae bacterium]|nr:HutD family protein [Burkholderiaceae bacterium]